jgi:hypothetical protein
MISLSPEEIAQQQELLAAHRRRLTVYLRQVADLGPTYAPPGTLTGIDDTRMEIAAGQGARSQSG